MAKQKSILESYYQDMAEFDFATDPYAWVMYVFPWGEGELASQEGPDEWQKDILNTIKKNLRNNMSLQDAIGTAIRVAVASGNGIGKSALVSWLSLWSISTFEDAKGIVTANTETQLRTKTWAELAKWYRLLLIKEMFVMSATAIYSSDKAHEKTWRIDAIPWSESNPEAFAGMHNQGKRILIIFDEASGIVDTIWEAIEGALTDKDTEIMWFAFGNPTRNTGRFYECFNTYANRWNNKQIDSRTVKISNKAQLNEWVEDYGEDHDFVKVHVRGMFPSQSLCQLISKEDVEEAMKRHLREDQYSFAPVIITCDPAWEGDDSLEIAMRQGLYFKLLKSIPKNDNDIEIGQMIAFYEDHYGADAVVIDIGWGSGIVSYGRQIGRNWMPIHFNSKSPDPGCANMRAYMWVKAKEWIKDGGCLPNDKELFNDLIGPETIPTKDGKIQLESKKDMKKRGLKSPNKADCLALSFSVPLGDRKNQRFKPKLEFAQTCHNPLKNNNNYNPIRRRY